MLLEKSEEGDAINVPYVHPVQQSIGRLPSNLSDQDVVDMSIPASPARRIHEGPRGADFTHTRILGGQMSITNRIVPCL